MNTQPTPTFMRAKMRVTSVESNTTTPLQEVKMVPVCGNKPLGPNGENEDNSFSRYTPSGELKLWISNPDLHGKIREGQEFYVDFTPAN